MITNVILDKLSQMSDLELLTRLLWGECRGEILQGQVAVANVVRNRVADGRYGKGWKGVILRPWQFSCFNPNDPNLKSMLNIASLSYYGELKQLAFLTLEGLLVDPTKGATHYFNPQVVPGRWPKSWNPDLMEFRGDIGRHKFYFEVRR